MRRRWVKSTRPARHLGASHWWPEEQVTVEVPVCEPVRFASRGLGISNAQSSRERGRMREWADLHDSQDRKWAKTSHQRGKAKRK